jgi:hypothetical protein
MPLTLHFARITDHHGARCSGSALWPALIAIGVARLEVENRFIDYFKESTEIYQGMELLDRRSAARFPWIS